MARFSWPTFVILLTISALFNYVEGGCFHGSDTLKICTPGTRTASSLFIDTNTTILGNEECTCSISQSSGGEVEFSTITGSEAPDCTVTATFTVGGNPIYRIDCLTDYKYTGDIDVNTEVALKLKGSGKMNACINMQSANRGSTLTVTCQQKTQIASTVSPPTTTTTQETTSTQTQGPTSTQTQGPTSTQTQGPTSTQTQGPTSTQTQGPTSTQTQGPTSTKTQGPTSTQTQGPTSTQTQGPTSTATTGSSSTKTPRSTASETPSRGSSTTAETRSGTTDGFAKFPVPEVAGGVAGGILLIILLVIIITCCTSRKKKREGDEESLKSHGSRTPEMQENKEGYAFDNLLYGLQRDQHSGKSITPPVSDADTQDYQATKGLEELYASVNKTITDSTDIM